MIHLNEYRAVGVQLKNANLNILKGRPRCPELRSTHYLSTDISPVATQENLTYWTILNIYSHVIRFMPENKHLETLTKKI